MNYQRAHDAIIAKAKGENRSKKNSFYERHHIVMTSVGGSNTDENTVLLTPKEHFIVHCLLWKMNPNVREYRDPIFMFKHKGAANSRLYEAARIEHIIFMKTHNPSLYLSDEAKASKSRKLKAYIKTEEHRENLSKAKKGKASRTGAVLSEVTKASISDSVKLWHQEVGISDETREKHRQRMLGTKHSYESIVKQKQKALNRKRYECPICYKTNLDGGNFNQHMQRIHEWERAACEDFKVK